MKTAGTNVAQVIRLLRVANNDIQSIEHRRQELRREAASLNAGNLIAAKTKQLSYEIFDTQKTLDHYSSLCKQAGSSPNGNSYRDGYEKGHKVDTIFRWSRDFSGHHYCLLISKGITTN